MSTSLKVADADKRRIDRLQGELTLFEGHKVSQQDLIADILDYIEDHKQQFLSKDRRYRPMSAEAIEQVLSASSDFGVVTREEDIDADLYSADQP